MQGSYLEEIIWHSRSQMPLLCNSLSRHYLPEFHTANVDAHAAIITRVSE